MLTTWDGFELPWESVSQNDTTNDNVLRILETTVVYKFGAGTRRHRDQTDLSEPYTLTQFADDTWAVLTNGTWIDGGTTVQLMPDAPKKCMSASMVRSAIRFPSKKGVKYHVEWQVLLTYTAPTFRTEVFKPSWEGMGVGGEMATDWVELPYPAVGESYTAEMFDVDIQPEGGEEGRCGDGCEDEEGDSPGAGKDYIDSAAFYISMGAGDMDASAGILAMHEEIPSDAMATPAALRFNVNTAVVTIVTNIDESIDVLAPTMLARIIPTNAHAYWIHCAARPGGEYDVDNPFISHLIMNPNGSTNFNSLRHITFRGSSAITNEFLCETNTTTNVTWSLVTGNGLKGERLTKLINTNGTRMEMYSIFTPQSQQELYRRHRLYATNQYTRKLLSEMIDPAGLALMTTNTYNAGGRLLTSERWDGSWERREYDTTNNLLVRIITPFTNQPPNASADVCRVTEYSYTAVLWSPETDVRMHRGKPRTVLKKIQGETISVTMHAYTTNGVNTNLYDLHIQTSANPSMIWNDEGNVQTFQREDADHRIVIIDHPNGTRTYTTYTNDVTGRWTVTRHGVLDITGAFYVGNITETKVDTLGRMVFRKTYDIPSGNILTSHHAYSEPDIFGRPTKITYLDGSTSVNVKQDCCQAAYTVDRQGVINTFTYDALNRLVATTRLGITTSNMLDAGGRLLTETRNGTDGSVITSRRLGYDRANRIIRETNALNHVTSYAFLIDGSSQRIHIVTNADGGTRIETYFRDGQLSSLTGTAVFPARHEYGQELEDGYQRPYRKEIKLDLSGNDTPEWNKVISDGMGRGYKTVFPGGATNQASFHSELWKERDPDGVTKVFDYNVMGERAFTIIDSSDNLGFNGTDRITHTINDVLSAHSTNVRRTRIYSWLENGVDTSTLMSTSETSVDGLRTWSDVAGAQSSTVRTIPSSGSYTITHTKPGGAYDLSLYQNGRLISDTQYDSGGTQIGKTTYGYDAHGRRNTITDARNGTTTFAFNELDQVVSVTTPAPGNGQAPQTTTTYYDTMGRTTNTVHPDGGSVLNVYSARGELLRTTGARTYPVAYAYDAQGRMKHMTNWSTYPSTGARVTTWNYDSGRGWLSNKRYPDNLGPDYTYTAAGRLQTRTWARTNGASRLSTTYSYNNFGDLSGIDYSDSTADLTYAYNRRGQQETITQSGNAWKLLYTTDGQLLSEAGTAGILNALRVTNRFDPFLRRTNLAAANAATHLTTSRYAYDLAGRLATGADGVYSATYSYVANSPLINDIIFKSNTAVRLTTTKTYDRLNRLIAISSAPSASSVMSFSYGHNNANQRVKVDTGDGAYWLYEYDKLGQVVSGKKYWNDHTPVPGQQFDYGFDEIGNRTSTKAGGDQHGTGVRSASYSANTLNQIAQRDVPGGIDVLGAARGTVAVNSDSSGFYRRDEYFRKELSINNSSSAQWESVSVTATDGSSTNQAGNIFLPETPETFSYDPDGNLTNDGRWAYAWDAENRLISMTTPSSAPSGSRKALHFAYDFKGRRISKVVSNWNSSAWVRSLDEKFVYDGWNPVAVLNGTNSTLLKSFLWGTDLIGTMQGAGGVGGLISITVPSGPEAGTYFYSYDGNGNVVGLINAADGSTSAQYAYGPFGEAIRATSSLANLNPFRFSTKYQDDETDFLYYGYRYYNASAGRWVSRDPIQEPGFRECAFRDLSEEMIFVLELDEDPNAYGFVSNDSLSQTDVLGLAKKLAKKKPAKNPCDGYKKFIPTPKCICNCKLISDPYPTNAEKVCNGFMNMYNWSSKAQCVAQCLVAIEATTYRNKWCSVRATVRLAAHIQCYASCGFYPWKGIPPGGVGVGGGDLAVIIAKCRDPWNQAE